MNSGELGGWIGGIAGAALGLMGGELGTFFSIRHTQSPRERAFVLRASVALWIVGAAFLAAVFLIPNPWRHFLWLFWALALPWGILKWNRRQQQIRVEECGPGSPQTASRSGEADEGAATPPG